MGAATPPYPTGRGLTYGLRRQLILLAALVLGLVTAAVTGVNTAVGKQRLERQLGEHARTLAALLGGVAVTRHRGRRMVELHVILKQMIARGLAGLLLCARLAGRIARPLTALTLSTQAVARGRFDRRIDLRTNDELGTLAVSFNGMLDQLKGSTEQIRRIAYFDPVTNLPNRVHFNQLLAHALTVARCERRGVAVLFLDLDRFKLINETFGHDLGDRLLRAFSARLTAAARAAETAGCAGAAADPAPTVARLGGDEFTVLLPGVQGAADVARVGERLLAALGRPFDLGGEQVVVGASVGIARYPVDGSDPGTLIQHADTAMHDAKSRSGNTCQFYSARLNARCLERLTLERELRRAIEMEALVLHYQPQVAAADGRVVGVEALIRWRHPRMGLVAPGAFVPLAEESGLIVPLGAWALRTACAQGRRWLDIGAGPLRVAVNVSPRQLHRPGFAGLVAAALAETGLPPGLLELELTETTAMADPDATAATPGELKAMGVQLALDDSAPATRA